MCFHIREPLDILLKAGEDPTLDMDGASTPLGDDATDPLLADGNGMSTIGEAAAEAAAACFLE